MQDTQPQTIFFTIDTGRTLRYLLFISSITAYVSFFALAFFPLILLGITFLIAGIFILFIDLLLILGSLILMIFGGGRLDLVVLSDITGLSIFDSLIEIQSTLMTIDSVLLLLFILAGIAVGIVLARYVEDRKSIRLVFLFHFIFSISVWQSLAIMYNLPISEALSLSFNGTSPLLYIALYLVGGLISSNYVFNRVHDDDLFDLLIFPRIVHVVIALLYVPIIAVFTFLFVIAILLFGADLFPNIPNYDPLQFIVVLITQLSTMFIVLHNAYWGFRGDLPMDVKLGELAYREELLEYAREFRELDQDNIDEFARKTM